MLKTNKQTESGNRSSNKRPIYLYIIVSVLFVKVVLLSLWTSSNTSYNHIVMTNYIKNNKSLSINIIHPPGTVHNYTGPESEEKKIESSDKYQIPGLNIEDTLQSLKYEKRIDCNEAEKKHPKAGASRVFAVVTSLSNELLSSAGDNLHFILVGQENVETDISGLEQTLQKDATPRFHIVLCRDVMGDNLTETISRIKTTMKNNFREKGLKAVIYLDFESQHTLWPRMSAFLPGTHISRKNIGYLMAIALRAEFIIDLEGSHTITQPDWLNRENLNNFKSGWKHPVIASLHSNVNNPYVLMGPRTNTEEQLNSENAMKNFWPRGYPNSEQVHNEVPSFHSLEEIETRLSERATKKSCFQFSNDIIQSLIDESPDIDSNPENGSPLPITFQPQSSRISVHPSQFAPFNGLATVFSRRAFWSLLLPGSGDDSDIMRGYIAQTFLHCTGSLLAFSAPIVRLAHRINQDNQGKTDSASRIHELIQLLATFDCKQSSSKLTKVEFNNTLPHCLILLYSKLTSLGFLGGNKDGSLIHVWINSLSSLGYRFPSFYQDEHCLPKQDSLYQPSWNFADHSFCGESLNTTLANPIRQDCGKSILTVVHINFSHKEVIPIWLALWQYVYPNPVFYISEYKQNRKSGMCVVEPTSHFNIVCNDKDDYGGLAYESLMHAHTRYPDYENYLFIHEDAFISHNTLEQVLSDGVSAFCKPVPDDGATSAWSWNVKVQRSFQILADRGEFQPDSAYRQLTEKYCPDLYQDETKLTEGKFLYYLNMGDVFVLRKSDIETFLLVINKYYEAELFLEVAIPVLFRCALNAREVDYTTYWDGRRANIYNNKAELCGENRPQILHPIWKISRGGRDFQQWAREVQMMIDIRTCDKS